MSTEAELDVIWDAHRADGEARLRRMVSDALAARSGCSVEILRLSCEPSPYATLAPVQIATAQLAGGKSVQLFVKSIGRPTADHPEKQRQDREPMIYQHLLRGSGLPVVDYFGSEHNDATGELDLLLEHVDGWNLKYQGLDIWFAAARRLAQLHLHFVARPDALAACDFLQQLDSDYFLDWARRAQAAVAERPVALVRRLDAVIDGYPTSVELMVRQPPTLVHNDLSPKNLIATRSSDTVRICLVDWELAGIGCGLLDLVHLSYGLGIVESDRMSRAYVDEATGSGLIPNDQDELDRLIAACALHKTLYRLAFSTEWNLPNERVAEWVGDAERFSAAVA